MRVRGLEVVEIVEAISSIQEDIADAMVSVVSQEGRYYLQDIKGEIYLEFRTDGYVFKIKFLGTTIWCNEDDDRIGIDEDSTTVETIEACLRRKINKLLAILANIKI